MAFFSPKSNSVATSNLIVYAREMHVRSSVFCLLPALLGLIGSSCVFHPKPKAFAPAEKRGVLYKILHPFGHRDGAPDAKRSGIAVTVQSDSLSPSLSASRQLGVRILVTNFTKTLVTLSFPTSQRIEILGRNADGKIFYDYQTDRSFTQEPAVLSINPGERLEYVESIPTKNMAAGQTYLIAASVVGRADLDGSVSIVPQP